MAARKANPIKVQHINRTMGVNVAATVTQETLEEIDRLAQGFGFQEVHLLKTSEITIARWVGLKCRYGCANFNKSWCCPPAAPDLEAIRELMGEYELAVLVISDNRNEHFYRNAMEKRRAQIKQWKATIALERRLFLMGFYKAFGLPAETCALCKECAYPDQCRFPNEKRPSLEACSIDVFNTLTRLGKSAGLARKVEDSFHSYSLILLV